MASTWKTRGVKEIISFMEKKKIELLKRPGVAIGLSGASRVVTRMGYDRRGRPKKGVGRSAKSESVTRSAVDHLIIWRTQKKRGRNPLFLRKNENKTIVESISPLLDSLSKPNSTATMSDVLTKVGKSILLTYGDHWDKGKSSRGSMKPLSPKYEAQKNQQGFQHKPILERTSTLRASVVFQPFGA